MSATDPTPASMSYPVRSSSDALGDESRAGLAKTLFVIDLPRSGSAWIGSALSERFGPGELVWVYEVAERPEAMSVEAFSKISDQSRDRLRAVMGYFAYGLHQRPGPWFSYLALLQDPVERVSLLHADFVRLAERIGRRQSEPGTSLRGFVFGQQHLAVDNGYVRAIAGRRHVRFGQCSADLYDEAIEHIERRFSALLLHDEPLRSREIVGSLIGLTIPSVDSTAEREHPLERYEPEVLQRIRELNRFDLQLYEYARERFETTYQRLVG